MRRLRERTTGNATTLEGQPAGAALRLVGVEGGRPRTMRLMQLGLRVGDTVMVTHARCGGVVVASAAGRIAVGADLARHIRVEDAGLEHHHDDRRHDDGRHDEGRHDDGRHDDGRHDEGRRDEGRH